MDKLFKAQMILELMSSLSSSDDKIIQELTSFKTNNCTSMPIRWHNHQYQILAKYTSRGNDMYFLISVDIISKIKIINNNYWHYNKQMILLIQY